MEQTMKKMLVLETGLYDDPEYFNLSSEDENKTFIDLMEEFAEKWESDGENAEANRVRGTIDTHRLFHKGSEISAETLIKDIVFDIVVEDGDTFYKAELIFQEDQSGGKK